MPQRVEALIQQGQQGLKDALNAYWPAIGRNEVGEATPLLHVGHAFNRAGFLTYSEVPNADATEHADLVALNFDTPLVAVIEGKRLFNSPKASSMAYDMERLVGSFELPAGQWSTLPPRADAFAVILGTTWKQSIRDWWCNHARPDHPTGHRGAGWPRLKQALQLAAVVNAVGIYDPPVQQQQHLVYAIASVAGGFAPPAGG